jgi:hypothetical protein
MKSPDKKLFFFYRSIPKELNEDMWIVRITLPPNAVADTLMSVSATDGNEVPLDSATFELSGKRIAISEGKGTLPYGDFVNGMNETAVWMFRSERTPVPGGLTFG